MSNENIYDGITGIREDIVQKVENYQFKKKENKKSGKKAWMKWGALAACLCLLIVAVSAIRNSTSTQEADTIELGEVLEWPDERVEKKLIGEYRGNILHSWGEPDVVLSETADKYYLNDDNSEYIILKYDSEGYIQEFVFGNDDVQGEEDNFETGDVDSVVGEPHVWAKEIISVVDHTVVEGIETADAEELFYSDDEYSYVFPSIKSQFVLVTFADGTVKTVVEALEDGEITIADLDNFEIIYIKKTK